MEYDEQSVLDSTYLNGMFTERERIISLLETEMCEAYGENCDDNPHCTARNRVIALIKGE